VCKLRKNNVVQNAKIKTLKAAYAQLQAKAESIGLPRGDHFRFDSVFTYKIQVNRNFEKKTKPVQTGRFHFGSVLFFMLKTETQSTGFDSFWFGYFIVKTGKKHCFFLFSFFRFGLVRFGFSVSSLRNRTKPNIF
jgi:hypothetical protein